MKKHFLVVCLSAPVFAAGTNELAFKEIAAPASDIVSGRVRLPAPEDLSTRSRAALIPLAFAPQPDGSWRFERTIDVAGAGPVSIAWMVPEAARFETEVRSAEGAFVPLGQAFDGRDTEFRTSSLGDDRPGWRADRLDVRDHPAGRYVLRMTSDDAVAPEGLLVVRDACDLALSAHVTTLETTSDREIALVAHVFDVRAGDDHAALPGVVTSCTLSIQVANGASSIAMLDDGRHQDGAAGDGVFGAFLPSWTSGEVLAQVDVLGLGPTRERFERSVRLGFPVVERRLAFSGAVTTRVLDPLHLRIEIGALPFSDVAQLHLSAEVWGLGEEETFVPVCWISRMLRPEARAGLWNLPIDVDGRWFDVARVRPPYVLREVRVQDPDTHVPYDRMDWVPLETPALPRIVGQGTSVVSSAMLGFPPPPAPGGPQDDALLAPRLFGRHLLLVHGYCSSGSIWPAADFTAPKQEFLDPNQNRTHDQFANLLLTAVPGRESFGVVAHSQGGPAALHLYTYYWSGLDRAQGPRLIQSVASPYQGTPLASLGSFACGVNNDMTPSGAATWLAGIPTWARAKVWYWTTSDAGSACNFFTGLLLTNPEDGTVEQFRGQLPGANSMGHVTGWCHTTGMTYPANYTDHARNAVMNTNAAR